MGRILSVMLVLGATGLSACFSESGLKDEFQEATKAVEALVDAVDEGPLREAADRASDVVDDARSALEDFRENPNAETRQALEDAERRLNRVRDSLERLVERAPENARDALGDLVDALERVRREIRQALED
jgi:ABC-type transporter Mla subunit MlaD